MIFLAAYYVVQRSQVPDRYRASGAGILGRRLADGRYVGNYDGDDSDSGGFCIGGLFAWAFRYTCSA